MAEVKVHPYPSAEWGWDVRLWEWTGPVENAEWIPSGDWLDHECPKSPPLFTLVACACAGVMPLGLMAGYALRTSGMGGLSLLMAMVAPFAGWFAIRFARRRRERWELLLILAALALVVETVPALMAVVAVVNAYIRHWL
ncbi:hypothetical protein [Luteolibacter sp. Populi]|uniref:hypothetical protein n=1 Tax=Luteolibacter sp. Populi TaxID=3230487 RepID=UPI00346511BD